MNAVNGSQHGVTTSQMKLVACSPMCNGCCGMQSGLLARLTFAAAAAATAQFLSVHSACCATGDGNAE